MDPKNKQLCINYVKKERHEHLKVEEQQWITLFVSHLLLCYASLFFCFKQQKQHKKNIWAFYTFTSTFRSREENWIDRHKLLKSS